jgi:hypothetical protein
MRILMEFLAHEYLSRYLHLFSCSTREPRTSNLLFVRVFIGPIEHFSSAFSAWHRSLDPSEPRRSLSASCAPGETARKNGAEKRRGKTARKNGAEKRHGITARNNGTEKRNASPLATTSTSLSRRALIFTFSPSFSNECATRPDCVGIFCISHSDISSPNCFHFIRICIYDLNCSSQWRAQYYNIYMPISAKTNIETLLHPGHQDFTLINLIVIKIYTYSILVLFITYASAFALLLITEALIFSR